MATLLYTQKPCGCLVLIMVNDPENLRACRSEITRELREGRTLHETEKANLPPMTCEEHKETRFPKPTPEQEPLALGL